MGERVDDVVETGTRPARLWGVAAVLALVALLVVALRANDGPLPGAAPSPSATAATGTATVSPSASTRQPVARPPQLLVAPRWTGRHDTLLLSHGVLTLRQRPGDFPQQLPAVGSHDPSLDAVRGGTLQLDRSDEETPDPEKAVVSFVPLGGDPVEVGEADAAAPALAAGTAWLVDYEEVEGAFQGTARRVDLRTGKVLQRVLLPPDQEVIAETTRGFVLLPMDETSPSIVWDPRTRTATRSFGGRVFDATETLALVVTERGCVSGCVAVAHVETGTETVVRGLDGSGSAPRLSPDGRWVAAFLPVDDLASELRVVELATGRLVRVGHSRISTTSTTSIEWSRDSRTLYVSTGFAEQGQVAAWRVGTPGIRILMDEGVWDLVPE